MNINETLARTVVSQYRLLLHYHLECIGGDEGVNRGGVCVTGVEGGVEGRRKPVDLFIIIEL